MILHNNNDVKQDTGSALCHAIIEMDYDLINKLSNGGAKTNSRDWMILGY